MSHRTEEARYSIEELAEQVETELRSRGLLGAPADQRVSAAPDARTIRYYTTLGLLDRPGLVDRQARYGRRHLLQLVSIKALQGLSLPLAEVQARLYGRGDRELEALLASIGGAEKAGKAQRVALTRWHEVTIEPGLRLVAEEGWSPRLSPDELEGRVRAALAALAKGSTTN